LTNHVKPLLLVSGFLGAGKTTFLRRMLATLDETEFYADVILNDFANAEIDTATLRGPSATTVSPIAAGCACCESLDELVFLCKSVYRSKANIILLELNGTADPLALLESFALMGDRLPFSPRLQICIIDARHWGKRNEFSLLEQRQLETVKCPEFGGQRILLFG
jgi:G3E family GTPase